MPTPPTRNTPADIHGSGQHLLNLINEILDLSRIEAGKYELNEEALSLAGIVEDCRHMLNLRAKAKGQIDPRGGGARAAQGLGRRARDPAGGAEHPLQRDQVHAARAARSSIKVGWTANGGQYVSVTDTGPGIPEDEIPVVLQTFGRGSLAIKTAEQGSGLGLPIVKGLIDLHGGGFHLKSKPRAGTEVTITLPAERVMDTLAALPEPERRRTTRERLELVALQPRHHCLARSDTSNMPVWRRRRARPRKLWSRSSSSLEMSAAFRASRDARAWLASPLERIATGRSRHASASLGRWISSVATQVDWLGPTGPRHSPHHAPQPGAWPVDCRSASEHRRDAETAVAAALTARGILVAVGMH